jgi:hypothetical protein
LEEVEAFLKRDGFYLKSFNLTGSTGFLEFIFNCSIAISHMKFAQI